MCFVVWSIVLLVFMCLGRRIVGAFSGAPLRRRNKTRIFWFRIVFALSAISMIAASFLLYGFGALKLQTVGNTIENANNDIGVILDECDAVATSLNALGRVGDEIRVELKAFLEIPFCPDYPDLAAETGIDFDEMRDDALGALSDLGDFIESDLVDVLDAIESAQKTVDDVDEEVNDVEDMWPWLVIVIIFIVLATWLLWGMLLAWFELASPIFTCLVRWVVLPLFIFFVFIAYLISSSAILFAVANAGKFLSFSAICVRLERSC